MKIRLFTLCCLLAPQCYALDAGEGQEQRMPPSFDELDANRDGNITRLEAGALKKDFWRYDRDRDGGIAPNEYYR